MRSFTSGSDSEWKVILLVLLVLGASEVFLRATETRLSHDLVHIYKIPRIAAKLASESHPRVLFLGNSMTNCGIDESAFKEELLAKGVGPVSVVRVFPDNTQIAEWYYAFRRYFVNRGNSPDYLIITCKASHLEDEASFSVYGMARHWVDPQDFGEVFHADVTLFGDQVDFLMSRASVTFANRFRISSRILYTLVPHYANLARQMNVTRNQMRHEQFKAKAQNKPTYKRLGRMAKFAHEHGTHMIVVAMRSETSTLSLRN